MAVITVSREIGSGGDEAAREAAQQLGYAFVDKQFIEQVLGQYGFIEFDQAYDSLPGFWEKFDAQKEQRRTDMTKLLNQAILALAQRDNVVILGRSGYVVLHGLADVLNVRMVAPEALRVARVAQQRELSQAQAAAKVAQVDRVRASFVEEFYRDEPQDAPAFDLLLNTGKIPIELAAEWIVAAARTLDVADLSGESTVATVKVDRVMVSAVAQEMADARA